MESYLNGDGTQIVYLEAHETPEGIDTHDTIFVWPIKGLDEANKLLDRISLTHDIKGAELHMQNGRLTEISLANDVLTGAFIPDGTQEEQLFRFPSFLAKTQAPAVQQKQWFVPAPQQTPPKPAPVEPPHATFTQAKHPNVVVDGYNTNLTPRKYFEQLSQQEKPGSRKWGHGISRREPVSNTALDVPTPSTIPQQVDDLSIEKLILQIASLIDPRFNDLRKESQDWIVDEITTQVVRRLERGINRAERSYRREERADARREKFIDDWSKRLGISPRDEFWDNYNVDSFSNILTWTAYALDSYNVIGEAALPYIDRGARGAIDITKTAVHTIQEHPRQIAASVVAAAVIASGVSPDTLDQSPFSSFDKTEQSIDVRPVSFIAPVQETTLLTASVDIEKDLGRIADAFGTTKEDIVKLNKQIDISAPIAPGTTLSLIAPTSVVTLAEPASVEDVARSFDLTTDAIAALNNATKPSDVLSGDVRLVGRLGLVTNGTPDLEKISEYSDVEITDLQELNANAPHNTVVLPTHTSREYSAEMLESLTKLVIDTPATQNNAIGIVSPAKVAQDPSLSTTSTSSSTIPSTTPAPSEPPSEQPKPTPEVPAAPAISPEIARLNAALANIKLGQPNDLTELTEAVKAAYGVYAPNDPHRRENLPEGYVKLMLPNEAPGISIRFTVAERTANVERYSAPETVAGFYAMEKLYEDLVATKYPQYAGSMLFARDFQSPNHRKHTATKFDVASTMSDTIKHYSDGPFGDRTFSDKYNEDLTADLLVEISKFSTRGVPTFKLAVTSIPTLRQKVDSRTSRHFAGKASDHNDHIHMDVNDAFELAPTGLRARDLPWDTEQDLRIGDQARSIDPAVLAEEHKEYNEWLGKQWQDAARALEQTPTEPVPAPTEPVPVEPATRSAVSIDDTGIIYHKDSTQPVLRPEQLPQWSRDMATKQFEYVKSTTIQDPATQKTMSLWDLYEEIGNQEGVSASYLFAIHYREASNDPNRSALSGEVLGTANFDSGKIEGTLRETLIKVAQRAKAVDKEFGFGNSAQSLPDQDAQRAKRHNRGKMYENAAKHGHNLTFRDSPYAMNGYTNQDPMKWNSVGHYGDGEDWGDPERVQGKVDQRVGVLPLIVVSGGYGHVYEQVQAQQNPSQAPITNSPTDTQPTTSEAPTSTIPSSDAPEKDEPISIRVTDQEVLETTANTSNTPAERTVNQEQRHKEIRAETRSEIPSTSAPSRDVVPGR